MLNLLRAPMSETEVKTVLSGAVFTLINASNLSCHASGKNLFGHVQEGSDQEEEPLKQVIHTLALCSTLLRKSPPGLRAPYWGVSWCGAAYWNWSKDSIRQYSGSKRMSFLVRVDSDFSLALRHELTAVFSYVIYRGSYMPSGDCRSGGCA